MNYLALILWIGDGTSEICYISGLSEVSQVGQLLLYTTERKTLGSLVVDSVISTFFTFKFSEKYVMSYINAHFLKRIEIKI